MGPANVRHDEMVTDLMLSSRTPGTMDLSSAYFNITDKYADGIFTASRFKRINIITASPKVYTPNPRHVQ